MLRSGSKSILEAGFLSDLCALVWIVAPNIFALFVEALVGRAITQSALEIATGDSAFKVTGIELAALLAVSKVILETGTGSDAVVAEVFLTLEFSVRSTPAVGSVADWVGEAIESFINTTKDGTGHFHERD